MAEIGPGWVYVLSNEAHPGVQKIGFTTDVPEVRAAELHSTGVPHPFLVEFKAYVAECAGLEMAVHHELAAYRINRNREFFKMAVLDAAKCIAKLAQTQAPEVDLRAYLRRDGELRLVRLARERPREAPEPVQPPPKPLPKPLPLSIVGTGGRGRSKSAYNLGIIYQNGEGVLQDYVKAYMWFDLAASSRGPMAENKNPKCDEQSLRAAESRAANARQDVARLMTEAQIAEAQKLAQEWRPE